MSSAWPWTGWAPVSLIGIDSGLFHFPHRITQSTVLSFWKFCSRTDNKTLINILILARWLRVKRKVSLLVRTNGELSPDWSSPQLYGAHCFGLSPASFPVCCLPSTRRPSDPGCRHDGNHDSQSSKAKQNNLRHFLLFYFFIHTNHLQQRNVLQSEFWVCTQLIVTVKWFV